MQPTNELRFVERYIATGDNTAYKIRILQQMWEGVVEDDYSKVFSKYVVEWRDVPCVKE